MKQRKLGWTNQQFSTIGLGTWAIGGAGWQYCWGPQDDRESKATILRALELGVNWIDTAPVYGLGHSEEIVGQAVNDYGEHVFIATKCGLVWSKKRKISGRLKRESIRSEVEASLKRLQVEVIDLYQIHWPMPDRDIEEAWAVMTELIKEGKIRYAGVSNFNSGQMKRSQAIHPLASLQPPYSMLCRDLEGELLDFCSSHNIGVIAYSPIQKGLLSGKFTRERLETLAPDDHRHHDPLFQEPALSKNLALVEELKSLAQDEGYSIAHLAIAWVLRHNSVTAAIVGARHPAQIEETVRASEWSLSDDIINQIDHLLTEYSNL